MAFTLTADTEQTLAPGTTPNRDYTVAVVAVNNTTGSIGRGGVSGRDFGTPGLIKG